jgi:VWFA-related protein
MIRRAFVPMLWCTVALAQLPAPQALPPVDVLSRPKSRAASTSLKTGWRVDAVAISADGRPVSDLNATDFEILADGKPQHVTDAEFRSSETLHIALIADNLSLSPENLAALRKALHGFVDGQMRPGDDAAVLRTSASEGIADQFTADRSVLNAAIDRLHSSPPAADSPLAFRAGSIAALRSALLGLQFTPGRKLAVFLSERLRARDRVPDPTWTSRLLTAANRGSVVLSIVDVASTADPSHELEQGLAAVAAGAGGAFFDAAGDPGVSLTRILAGQQGYYILRFETESLQRMTPLAVTARRPDVLVRARNGVLGLAGDSAGRAAVAPENQLQAAIGSTLLATGLHLDVTLKPTPPPDPHVEALFRANLNEVTLTQRSDGRYYGELQALVGIYQDNDTPAAQANRGVQLNFTPEERQKWIDSGFRFALRLPVPKKGPYQVRASLLDEPGGRLGAAASFWEMRDLPLPLLTMAPIQMEPAGDPPRLVYPPGQPVRYTYDLANLRNDGAGHAKVEVVNRLMREGRVIYAGEPTVLDVGLAPQESSARISGTVKLGGEVQPGKFTLTITARDTLASGGAPHTATRTVDFEIHP